MRSAAIILRSSLLIAVALSCVAVPTTAAAAASDPYQTAATVDALLASELFGENTALAPPAADDVFLRRVMLDLVGDIPQPEQTAAFLLDPAGDKRRRVVRELLDEPQYGQNWARYWRDVILTRRQEDRALIVANSLVVHLTDRFNRNAGWDQIAREFITATGNVRENGATAIVTAQEARTEEVTAEVSRIFLGVQIQCAQCHDHPYDRWKREQFHEMAAFFPRVALRPLRSATTRSLAVFGDDNPPPRRNRNNPNRRGRLEHYMPDLDDASARGTLSAPKFFLSGATVPVGSSDQQRRGQLATWVSQSPWFSTAVVNRIWSELVGEGFYEPVDDLSPDREPTAPQTVQFLSQQFAASQYDLKWLLETICATEAYARQSRPRRLPDATPFTANVAQRLRSDQLYNALLTALERPERNQGENRPRRDRGPRQLFQLSFGYDPSVERDQIAGSIPQALLMMNARQLHRDMLARGEQTMLGRLLETADRDEDLVYELYLRCLAREPTRKELRTALSYRAEAPGRREAFEDLLWALLNSAEFLHRR